MTPLPGLVTPPPERAAAARLSANPNRLDLASS